MSKQGFRRSRERQDPVLLRATLNKILGPAGKPDTGGREMSPVEKALSRIERRLEKIERRLDQPQKIDLRLLLLKLKPKKKPTGPLPKKGR